jgi:predicted adenylyl cyclase CyaB
MPVNLELKARIHSPMSVMQTLRKIGRSTETLVQVDTYFRVTKGRLKLRELKKGKGELIFYNRAENTGRRWSNFNILTISNTKGMKKFLKGALGIAAVVQKIRRVYYYREDGRIHFDRVKGLGTFIEFEVLCKNDKKNAIRLYNELVIIFGIKKKDIVRGSYADLIRQKLGSR